MRASDFVNKIQRLKPNIKDFERADVSKMLIEQWIKEFDVYQISEKKHDHEVLVLISNYNISNLRINDITFDPDYQEDGEYIYFGWDINDRLVLNKHNGRIFAYDGFGERVVYKCAESSEKFLDALYELAKFSKEKMLTIYTEEQIDEKARNIAYIAALKAGGEEYEDYYKSVLWVE